MTLQRSGGAVLVSQVGQVITVAGMLLGWALFGERVGVAEAVGVGAILGGVALVKGGGRAGGAKR